MQHSQLKLLKTLGGTTKYACVTDNLDHSLEVVIFCDGGRFIEKAQLSSTAGFLVNGLKHGSVFHVLSWSAYRPHRPVKPSRAAEIIAAEEAIYEMKTMAPSLATL